MRADRSYLGFQGHAPLPLIPELKTRDERLRALDHLAGQLAHDFNNFLAPILGYMSLIREELPADSMANQYLDAMESSARKTEGLLDLVLLVARPQRKFRATTVDVAALTDRILDKWESELPPNARIQLEKGLTPVSAWLDEKLWTCAVVHLLKNAHFALATGGTLRVSLASEKLSEEKAAGLGIAGTETLCLVVQDNGFGISPAVLDRVFQPFFSTRPKTQGQGLGLAIVHSVARLHGGQVLIESQEEVGTTVTVWIPIWKEAPAPDPTFIRSTVLKETHAQHIPRGLKVLLVDDDPMVVEVLRAALTRDQFEVYAALDGQEGWDIYRKHSSEVGLVISDITMPRMNGVDMVQRIRQLNPGVPVLFVSGDADPKSEGYFDIKPAPPPLIQKPFTLKQLIDAVRGLVER